MYQLNKFLESLVAHPTEDRIRLVNNYKENNIAMINWDLLFKELHEDICKSMKKVSIDGYPLTFYVCTMNRQVEAIKDFNYVTEYLILFWCDKSNSSGVRIYEDYRRTVIEINYDNELNTYKERYKKEFSKDIWAHVTCNAYNWDYGLSKEFGWIDYHLIKSLISNERME